MPKTVLIVDDSAAMRQLVSSALANGGLEAVAASSAREALALLEGTKIDLVITDLNMPEMDGIELIRSVRALPACRFVPIIMLTTESQDAKKQEGRKAGASGWVVKPFSPRSLMNVVRKFVE